MFVVTKTGIFKPKHDLFPNPNQVVLVPQPIQNISTAVSQDRTENSTSMKFDAYIHVPQMMNHIDFPFHLVALSSQTSSQKRGKL